MKRKILSLIVSLCLIVFQIPNLSVMVSASSNILYGNVIARGISNNSLVHKPLLLIADADGNETEYECYDFMRVNGQRYDDINDLIDAVPVGTFAEFMLNEHDEIAALNFDEDAIIYSNVAYDMERNLFEGLDAETSSLPIYYSYYDDEFITPYLDENHTYIIEVYDYAINITEMTALNKPETIKYIDIYGSANLNFLHDIYVDCDTTSTNSVLVGQLYDSKMNLMSETEEPCYGWAEISFEDLANEDAFYYVKLWLEDASGNIISPVYNKTYFLKEVPIVSGSIVKLGISHGIDGETLNLLVCDAQGNETIYRCSKRVWLNEKQYNDAEELKSALSEGDFIRFADENGKITVIKRSYEYNPPEKITGRFKFVPTTNIAKEYKNEVSQLSHVEDFSYDDTYFDASAKEYNHGLARTSIRLAMSAFGKQYVENGKNKYDRQYENVADFMQKMKFINISHNSDYEKQPTENSIGVAAGMKRLSLSNSGNCTLVVVAIRGGCYESEWAGNFNVGSGNIHEGFNEAANKVVSYVKDYIETNNIGGNIKIWITGYSRAAATANISAKKIIDGELGSNIAVDSSNVYAYCFETPSGALNPSATGDYSSIFSIVNQHDLVPMVAPSKWGYGRYGVTKYIPSPELDKKYSEKEGDVHWMYDMLDSDIVSIAQRKVEDVTRKKDKKGNIIPVLKRAASYYKIDNFQMRELDWSLGQGLHIQDASYNLPQGIFLERTIDKLAVILKNPQYYSAELQPAVTYLVKNTLGSGNLDVFFDCLLSNTLATSPWLISPGFTTTEIKSILKQTFKDISISVSDSALNSAAGLLVQLFADDSIFTIIDNIESIAQGHYPELCMVWLDAIGKNDFSPTTLRTIYLNCPVDIEVYDSNNTLVAAIYNDVPQTIENSSIVSLVDENGQKIIYLPGDEEYSIRTTATGEGEVNYSIQEYDLETGETSVTNYLDMQVANGDVITSVAENLSTDEGVYALQLNAQNVTPTDTIENAEKFDVTVQAEGNGVTSGGGSFFKGEYAKVIAVAHTNESFEGWYNNGTLVSNDSEYRFEVVSDTDLVAKFSENKCRIVFMSEDEIVSISEIISGDSVEVPVAPNKDGYNFDGWYSDEEYVVLFDENTTFTDDAIIYAKYTILSSEPTPSRNSGGGGTSTYAIKFETNGGSKIDSVKVTKNQTIDEPIVPEKEGYSFIGWFIDAELTTAYDFDSKITKGFTLYAKWVKHDDEHTIKFENPFEDVKTDSWYYEDVSYAVENGLFNGITVNIFAPDNNLTRAMLVATLYRADGEPEVTNKVVFEDVEKDSYYEKAVIWAKENDIVSGVTQNEFAPDDNITREQIATIMYRYARYKQYDVSWGENTNILSYHDFAKISKYAIAPMQYVAENGLIKGKTESTLNPKDFATRAETAAILHRFIEAYR